MRKAIIIFKKNKSDTLILKNRKIIEIPPTNPPRINLYIFVCLLNISDTLSNNRKSKNIFNKNITSI